LSTKLFKAFLDDKGISATLLMATTDFMKIDEDGEPDIDFIENQLTKIISKQHETGTFNKISSLNCHGVGFVLKVRNSPLFEGYHLYN
jgi:hypothetical protein